MFKICTRACPQKGRFQIGPPTAATPGKQKGDLSTFTSQWDPPNVRFRLLIGGRLSVFPGCCVETARMFHLQNVKLCAAGLTTTQVWRLPGTMSWLWGAGHVAADGRSRREGRGVLRRGDQRLRERQTSEPWDLTP